MSWEYAPLPGSGMVVILAPHPDDPDACAVFQRMLQLGGWDIQWIILTTGWSGVRDEFVGPDKQAKAERRRREQLESARLFGIDSVTFLNLPETADGELADDPAGYALMVKHLDNPDIVIVPWGQDTNPTHRLAYEWFTRWKEGRAVTAFFAEDPKSHDFWPHLNVMFDEEVAAWKASLLECHRSQTDRNLATRGMTFSERILSVNLQSPGVYRERYRIGGKPVFVIGREMAAAARREEEHRAEREPNEPSPIGRKYDFWKGEYNLLDPHPSPLDEQIRALCHRFLEAQAAERKAIRSVLSMEDFYTLMTFASRSAVFALRENNLDYAADGMIAMAIVERDRVDYRDIPLHLCLPYHAANRIGRNAYQLFLKITEQTGGPIQGEVVSEEVLAKRFRIQDSGYDEVTTKYGIGFCHHEYSDYNPTYDLLRMAVDIAELFTADKYQLDYITLGQDLPSVWLQRARDPRLDGALEASKAGISIYAKPRPEAHPSYEYQSLNTWLLELEDEASARTLQEICGEVWNAGYGIIGVSAGRLFCAVIQSAWHVGVSTYETTESLSRFSDGITHILAV